MSSSSLLLRFSSPSSLLLPSTSCLSSLAPSARLQSCPPSDVYIALAIIVELISYKISMVRRGTTGKSEEDNNTKYSPPSFFRLCLFSLLSSLLRWPLGKDLPLLHLLSLSSVLNLTIINVDFDPTTVVEVGLPEMIKRLKD